MPMATNGLSNRPCNGHTDDEIFDLVCVGFGPASLAIAVALHDKQANAKVLYLERQREFKWHAGMLLPDARMQISFLKDLATLRDPRSKFTFLNYLKAKNRLVAFTNLSTFLPLREEYNDYLSWCASHFDEDVRYGSETLEILPISDVKEMVKGWRVLSRNTDSGKTSSVQTRNVVIAVGGKPKIPKGLSDPSSDSPIIHSSSYSSAVPQLLENKRDRRAIAIIGGGQSAAEILNDLQARFENVSVTLYTGDSALRPSDDSPFVNEVFDPERVDEFYSLPSELQQETLSKNKATNYGVVRPALLDKLYEIMYHQRLHQPDETQWQHRIITNTTVIGHERQADGCTVLRLRNTHNGSVGPSHRAFDLVIVGTGYVRDAHEKMLESTKSLLHKTDRFDVGRDYRVKYRDDAVKPRCGIWLQGCCQDSHGLGDSLLSLLAVRGGEMVDNIFPPPHRANGTNGIHH